MKKILALMCALTLIVVGGIAFADDPNGDIQAARDLLAQADALLAQEQAKPPVVTTVTETATVTETTTATVTETVTPTTTTPSPTPTTPSPTPTTTSTTPPPPPPGFPSRAEALARPNVVVLSGTRSTQYKPGPATEATYDFRNLTSTAFPSTGYPIVLEGTRNVAIGGTVIGQQPRSNTWEQVHDAIGGYGGRMFTNDYAVWYDFHVENVTDGLGFDLLSACGSLPGPATCEYLVDNAYMEWIRDDGIEVDQPEFSGTIRNVVMNGVNNAFSFGQSTKNANAVTNIENVLIIHAVMNNGHAADGAGHQTIFKQKPGGTVNMTNVTDCLYENPITPSRIQIRPTGTWTNVVFVLGPGWVGADPAVPAGATVSHNWTGLCT